MNNNIKNIFEIFFGIAFGILFRWKVDQIYIMSDRTSVQVALFAAGIFFFYLLLHVCRYFYRHYKRYGLFSYGGITGAAFVVFAVLLTLFVHTPRETINLLKIVVSIWGAFIVAYSAMNKKL